jgi:hypothetical protein
MDGTTKVIEIYDSNSNGLCYRNPSAADVKISDISANTWYMIKLDIDVASNTFNVYLDGDLKCSDCPFRRTAAKVDGITFESGSGFTGTSYFDDVVVEVADLVNDNFNGNTTAGLPKGWVVTANTNTSCQVWEMPGATDKSMRLYDANTASAVTVSKPFAKQKGIIITEFSINDSAAGTWSRFFLQDGSTNAIEIYNSDLDGLCYRDCNSDDFKIMDIAPSTWYTVKVVADPSVDRFDVYVNGQLLAAGCSFRNIVSGIDQVVFGSGESYTGTTYINNASVLKGE